MGAAAIRRGSCIDAAATTSMRQSGGKCPMTRRRLFVYRRQSDQGDGGDLGGTATAAEVSGKQGQGGEMRKIYSLLNLVGFRHQGK